jgi:hypothetical protein
VRRPITGGFLALGSISEMAAAEEPGWRSLKNVPQLLGECVWTLLQDNMFEPRPRVTFIVRLP